MKYYNLAILANQMNCLLLSFQIVIICKFDIISNSKFLLLLLLLTQSSQITKPNKSAMFKPTLWYKLKNLQSNPFWFMYTEYFSLNASSVKRIYYINFNTFKHQNSTNLLKRNQQITSTEQGLSHHLQ